jgi:hypothetical protein
MNKIIFLLLMITVVSCDRKPFVEHKISFEKVADDCKDQQATFHLNSNFGGERYEFEKCLPSDFNKDDVVSERKGDSVVVRFKRTSGPKNVVYHLKLDIDSYPQYSYITIDGDTYTIGQVKK